MRPLKRKATRQSEAVYLRIHVVMVGWGCGYKQRLTKLKSKGSSELSAAREPAAITEIQSQVGEWRGFIREKGEGSGAP